MGFQKLGFFCYSSCQRIGFLQMKNQMPKVHCSLCSHKHQGSKVDSSLGRKSILFSFAFVEKGRGGVDQVFFELFECRCIV
jgi:hypothetical protein